MIIMYFIIRPRCQSTLFYKKYEMTIGKIYILEIVRTTFFKAPKKYEMTIGKIYILRKLF